MAVIPVLEKQKKDQEFKVSIGSMRCHKKAKQIKKPIPR